MDLDPNFSPAYGLAARCHINRVIHGSDGQIEKVKAEVRRLASCVAVTGRDDAESICWAGFALARICGDVETGGAMIDQGLSICPNLPRSLQLQAAVSVMRGEHEAAIEQAMRALRFNPVDPSSFVSELSITTAYICLGRYADSVSWATRALARRPDWMPTVRTAACAHALDGNVEEARRLMARVLQGAPQWRLSNLREQNVCRRQQDLERLTEGLRLAGMPE
jgi:tetratricopeptide (TPR) repeat protein